MGMLPPHELYNTLPSLGDAWGAFTNKDVLVGLSNVFDGYPEYSACLVHRHTTLSEGGRMVAVGDVTSPDKREVAYPQAWLTTGEPFEYSDSLSDKTLPEKLLENFRQFVEANPDVNVVAGKSILGICRSPAELSYGEVYRGKTLPFRLVGS